MAVIVFDANAFIAILANEVGVDAVQQVLEDCQTGEHTGMVHALNLYEVERWVRVNRPETAPVIMRTLRSVLRAHCIRTIRRVTLRMQKQMVSLKMAAGSKFSALDAACVAAGITNDGYVLTSDHAEMDGLETAGMAPFLWFR